MKVAAAIVPSPRSTASTPHTPVVGTPITPTSRRSADGGWEAKELVESEDEDMVERGGQGFGRGGSGNGSGGFERVQGGRGVGSSSTSSSAKLATTKRTSQVISDDDVDLAAKPVQFIL
jgi:hypothetical protein